MFIGEKDISHQNWIIRLLIHPRRVGGWVSEWVDGWVGGWVDGWVGGWVDLVFIGVGGWVGGWVSG